MPNFLEFLRQQNIFGGGGLPPPATPIPQPIGGNMGGMATSGIPMDVNSIPPPQFEMPGIYADTRPSPQDPYDVNFGRGPLDINQFDLQQARGGITPQGPPEYDAGSRMKELYNPTTDATKKFEDMIGQYPQEQNPGWLRRIAAMLVDYTKGHQAGQEFFNEPRTNAIEDWKNKIGPSQQAANLERYENVNQRTMAYQQISMELRDKAQEAKERNDIRSAEIRQQRADTYDWRTKHPLDKLIFPRGGFVQAENPITHEVITLSDSDGNPIKVGNLTQLDQMNLGQENALERIGETGAQARQTEGVRQTGRIEAIGARGEEARKTRAIPSGGVGGKPETAANKKTREYLTARELRNTNPELRPFIHLDKTGPGTFDIDIPVWNKLMGASGPTREQYDQIQDYIYSKPSVKLDGQTSNQPGGVKILSITRVK